MPYFVYKVIEKPFKQLELLQSFPSFKEANVVVKAKRSEMKQAGETCLVRLIFAANELEAEDSLNQVREPEPMIGDDY
ncbi:MAG: hypothetical protein ACYC2R_15500 [Burkholderiales bacterium]|nr:hypothetical protein [Sulfuricellaceae bacterium]